MVYQEFASVPGINDSLLYKIGTKWETWGENFVLRLLVGDTQHLSFEEKEARINPKHQNGRILTVEVVGLSDSGKSTVLQKIGGELGKRGIEVQINEEFRSKHPLSEETMKNASILKATPAYRAQTASSMESVKAMATDDFRYETLALIEELSNEARSRRVVKIIERGPHDQIAMAGWVAEQIETLPEGDDFNKSHYEEFWRLRLFKALGDTEFVQTTVLFYIDLDEIQNRRVAAGLPREGILANPKDHPIVSAGYLRWLHYLIPETKSGFLVVNGNNPLETNIQQIVNHFENNLTM